MEQIATAQAAVPQQMVIKTYTDKGEKEWLVRK